MKRIRKKRKKAHVTDKVDVAKDRLTATLKERTEGQGKLLEANRRLILAQQIVIGEMKKLNDSLREQNDSLRNQLAGKEALSEIPDLPPPLTADQMRELLATGEEELQRLLIEQGLIGGKDG